MQQPKKVFFIGIGGSSMSGLARYMKWKGCEVYGSDKTSSHKTEALEKEGFRIFIGHRAENVSGCDLVVYSAAIQENNPERTFAREHNIPQIERCELLGEIMKRYPASICVSGTHGKTTTTAMLSWVFIKCGEDPSVHIGGELEMIGGSTRMGNGESFICEACEYHSSFLSFHPTQAIITNIDADHLDYYKDLDDIEHAFEKFARLVPQSGCVFGNGDDKRVFRLLERLNVKTVSFGLEPQNVIRAENIYYDENDCASFTVTYFGHPLCEISLNVPGEHNLRDALACIAVANANQLPMAVVSQALQEFSGVHRRYELTSVTDGVNIYTDYGHNPTETETVLKVARAQCNGRVFAVLQPHTYSRTKSLFHGFLNCFNDADQVLVLDIDGAREKDPGDINSGMLVEAMVKKGMDAHYTPTFDDAENYLRNTWKPGDCAVTLGCGNVYLLNEQIALHGNTVSR
ncbi:MAG: UDP-N-acetylmuramate--L-alanine ligase [Clostridiales bacterium]|nr:UDP-N-acetylmuramate--L-alanine ligase [Clostridiales bacterium]